MSLKTILNEELNIEAVTINLMSLPSTVGYCYRIGLSHRFSVRAFVIEIQGGLGPIAVDCFGETVAPHLD